MLNRQGPQKRVAGVPGVSVKIPQAVPVPTRTTREEEVRGTTRCAQHRDKRRLKESNLYLWLWRPASCHWTKPSRLYALVYLTIQHAARIRKPIRKRKQERFCLRRGEGGRATQETRAKGIEPLPPLKRGKPNLSVSRGLAIHWQIKGVSNLTILRYFGACCEIRALSSVSWPAHEATTTSDFMRLAGVALGTMGAFHRPLVTHHTIMVK